MWPVGVLMVRFGTAGSIPAAESRAGDQLEMGSAENDDSGIAPVRYRVEVNLVGLHVVFACSAKPAKGVFRRTIG